MEYRLGLGLGLDLGLGLKDQSSNLQSHKKRNIRKDHEKWSIFCFYGMFWIVVVIEIIAFEILKLFVVM